VVRFGMEDCDCGKAGGLSRKPAVGQRRPPRTAARAALCHRERPVAADDEHGLVLDIGRMRALEAAAALGRLAERIASRSVALPRSRLRRPSRRKRYDHRRQGRGGYISAVISEHRHGVGPL
jgi:hypothetical protein